VRGTGEPLLLHHGYTASRVNWMPVAERLEDRYQIILMECRGTGDSEHTDDGYSLEQYAADVVGLLDHLGLPTVSFAGHSMVLMAPIPADGTGEVDPQLREERRQLRRSGDRDGLLQRYKAMRFRPEVETDAWLEDRVEHVLGVSDGHYEGGAQAMHELQVGHRLGGLATPTLMIAGAVDSLLTTNLNDFLHLPNATLEVLSRAGHEVAIHEPDAVARAIAGFMAHGPISAGTLHAQLAARSA
jgi:pimeloyl-ACP methyl ester carboxylesterase